MKPLRPAPKWVLALQFASLGGIWVFVLGISYWILHLIRLARQWHDVPSASIAISVVAIPVFWTGAGVLTYVFFGLRRGRRSSPGQSRSPGPQSGPGPSEVGDESHQDQTE